MTMKICPFFWRLLHGQWRRRRPPPKQTVEFFPTPKLEPVQMISPERMRQLQKQFARAGRRPGTTVVMTDGSEYVVQKDGSWKRNDAARRN